MTSRARIGLLAGSLHAGSTNRAALAAVRAALQRHGLQPEDIAGLGDLPFFRPDLDPPPDAVLAWHAALTPLDGLVIASPEYAAGPPGALKNGLDWLVGLSTLYRTPVAVLCAGSTGGAFTIESLVRTLSYQGALTVATLGIGGARTKVATDGAFVDPSTLDDIEALASRLAESVDADEATLLRLVTPVVGAHGIDPARFGLTAG